MLLCFVTARLSLRCNSLWSLINWFTVTYYPDRPDVMATFKRVRIEADKAKFPVLLSNGNKLDEGDCNDDRHFAVWQGQFRMMIRASSYIIS